MNREAALIGAIISIILLFLFYPFVQGATFPTFLSLIDTPNSYIGMAGKVATVNSDENALIFTDANGGSGIDTNCSLNANCVIKTTSDANTGSGIFGYLTNGGFRVGEKNNNNCIRFFPNADGLGVTGGLLLPCVEGMQVGLNGIATFGNIDIKGSLRNYNLAVAPIIAGSNQFVFESQAAGSGSGIQFHDSAFAFDFKVANTSYAQLHVPGIGVLRLRPSTTEPVPFLGDKNYSGSQCMFKTYPDGNFWMCQQTPDQNFMRLQQSAYGPREVIQGNDWNGMLGIRTPGSISFYGVNDTNNIIDYNVGTDRNQMFFLLKDRNSSYLFSQFTSSGQRIDSFYLDGNGNPYLFRIPTSAATLQAMQWDSNTGKVYVRASDSDLKDDIQDNPYDASWCYDLEPKIWTDKITGHPGIGYLAEDVEMLLKSKNIPTWMIQTDAAGNKLILYDAINEFCWKAAIEDHKKLQETQTKLGLIIQLVCPVGKIDPICDLLNAQSNPV